MSKRQHPSARELRHDTQGQLYGKEARESDGMLALRRAQHIESSRLFFKGRTQKRLIIGKNQSGRLTEHVEALAEDVNRTREQVPALLP